MSNEINNIERNLTIIKNKLNVLKQLKMFKDTLTFGDRQPDFDGYDEVINVLLMYGIQFENVKNKDGENIWDIMKNCNSNLKEYICKIE